MDEPNRTKINIAGPEEEAYRSAPMVRFSLGHDRELVYFPLEKITRVISTPEARLLASCTQFATIGAHASRIMSGLAPGSAEVSSITEFLEECATEGLALPYTKLVTGVDCGECAERPSGISWLAIPTCNRPELLRRAIKSFAAHFSRFGRFPRLLVADDARLPAANRAAKAVVEEEALNWRAAVTYLGPSEKCRLIEQLVRDGGFEAEVLANGVLPPAGDYPTSGANRNAILLKTAGAMVLSADDDTLCEPYVAKDSASGILTFGGEGDSAELRFFADRDSALASVRPADVDVLAEHEALLGRHLRVLAQRDGRRRIDFTSACDHTIKDLWTGGGRVLITLNGCVGDSGLYMAPTPAHCGNPNSRRRLIESEEAYRIALNSREVTRQVPAVYVGHGGPLIGMFFGLDNRDLLPPFFPLGPNEDGTMAYMIGECLESERRYIGSLPWSLVHSPVCSRSYLAQVGPIVTIFDVVVICASVWVRSALRTDSASRLRSLGQHLVELGSMQPAEFDEIIRITLLRHLQQRVARHEALLVESRNSHGAWADDLRRDVEASLAAVSKPDFGAPIALLSNRGLSGPVRNAQEMVRRFGKLVRCWPDVTARAKELGETD